jgi:hypothetical protein
MNANAIVRFLLVLGAMQLTLAAAMAVQSPAGQAAPPAAPARPDSGLPPAPAGAQFTIYCGKIDTMDHVARANALKAELTASTSLKQWYVVHQDGQSVIYHGFYAAIEDAVDPREAARARQDREVVDQIQVGNQRLFARAIFVPLDSPDPEAPPQWNILNVDATKPDADPTKAYWTLEVGVYTGHVDRKKFAVDAVREARRLGIDAYYFHGPGTSSVLVGRWAKDAVEIREVREANRDPDQVLFISQAKLPPQAQQMRDKDGQPLNIIEPESTVRDPTLLKALQQFPTFGVNGVEDTMQIGKQVIAKPSVLRRIPRELGPSGGASAAAAPAEQPKLVQPDQKPQRGGRLKSIGG